MQSYSTSAAVGAFPRSTVSYLGYNTEYYGSGQNLRNPALLHDRTQSPLMFNIPSSQNGTEPVSVLRPGDITISITSSPRLSNLSAVHGTGMAIAADNYDNIHHIGSDIDDLKIQSYDISIDLNRKTLEDLQAKKPLDSVIQQPITTNLSFDTIVGEPITGSLLEQINKNDDYDIVITVVNPVINATALRYDFVRAKLLNSDYNITIGNNKTNRFSFDVELDPEYFTRGFYISGLLNVQFPTNGNVDNAYLLEYGEFVSTT
jgi:hypothetical protein